VIERGRRDVGRRFVGRLLGAEFAPSLGAGFARWLRAEFAPSLGAGFATSFGAGSAPSLAAGSAPSLAAGSARALAAGFAVALAAGFGLALAVPARAADAVDVVSHPSWILGLDSGVIRPVAPSGTYSYCMSNRVEALQPTFTLSRSAGGERYSESIVGPPAAGNAPPSKGQIFRRGGTFSPTFVGLDFPKMSRGSVMYFPAGTYRYILRIGGRVALSETVKLAVRAGC